MSIVKEEYRDLPPRGEKLCDVVVLAQAWKKSHTYIRRHNWYADVLELDASTIDLEDKLMQWAAEVCRDDFRPEKLLLVPAPKNAFWSFRPVPSTVEELMALDIDSLGPEPSFDDWAPRKRVNTEQLPVGEAPSELQKLRPLAHLSIRDQTLATAVLMCLAEAVESAQGDTTGNDVLAMRANGVVSYGNRLHCTWSTDAIGRSRARFSWGNSRTYRQYFQDYRTFLARPRRVCAELAPQLLPRRELYVVSLDIKSFFDHVDRGALLAELKDLEAEHRGVHGLPPESAADAAFWERAAHIFSWQWRAEDQHQAELILGDARPTLELGLPQGLVALSRIAVMEPRMFGVMEPVSGC